MRSRPIAPATLIRRQVVLEDHVLLPDGRAAVVVERTVHGETYRSHLLLVPLAAGGKGRAAGAPVRLTAGAVRDTSPQAAPDGRRVAFLRSFPDDQDALSRVMIAVIGGGEPWTLWEAPRGVSEIAWSPDSRQLALVAPADKPRFLVGPERPGRTPTARRITRADWRWDEVGHRDRWDHAWVMAVREGARPRRLTEGDFDVRGLAWSPDGRWLAFSADPRPTAELAPRPSIHLVPSAPAQAPHAAREVLALAGFAGSPSFSPSGRLVAVTGVDVADPLDDEQPGVFVAPFDPETGAAGAAHALAPDLDRPVGAWLDTDLNGWMCSARSGPVWESETALLALISDRGRALPWRFGVAPSGAPASAPTRLADADVAGWSFGAAGGVVTVLGTLDDRPMELMTIETGKLAPRTRAGSAWRRGLPWPQMERTEVPGPGGPIETWIASPADTHGQRGPLPAVIDIHGGPLGAWAAAPSLETVLLCARGYRVVLPNIRGSAGYGRAWIRPQLGDWGGVDAADVLAVADHTVAAGLADPARLGILGLSYGGFMVNWLVGAEPRRFAAAVVENGVANQVNTWANSDSGPEYNRASLLGDPLDPAGIEKLWRQSPLRNVGRIRTPLLMLQAESDLRCPAADNEQLFIALRALGRTVEYVLYPESWHTYAVTGRPDRRIDRNERMLAWFDRYLGAGG